MKPGVTYQGEPLTFKESMVMLAACKAVFEAVEESGPLGVPRGIIYLALATQGCTVRTFDLIVEVLIEAGKLRQEGDLLFAE